MIKSALILASATVFLGIFSLHGSTNQVFVTLSEQSAYVVRTNFTEPELANARTNSECLPQEQ